MGEGMVGEGDPLRLVCCGGDGRRQGPAPGDQRRGDQQDRNRAILADLRHEAIGPEGRGGLQPRIRPEGLHEGGVGHKEATRAGKGRAGQGLGG